MKVTFIGAGSTVFALNLLGDILSFEELRDCEIALHDINQERLDITEAVVRKAVEKLEAPTRVTATLDRREALNGANYVLTMIQVGGYRPATVTDFEIPKKYGLRQTIADTLGIGGIMRGLRTVPVLVDIARDMEELCPDAPLLQYVNPMAINCWALSELTAIKTVGLCHSVQGTAGELARDLGIPVAEIDYQAAGINHMAFYLHFRHRGRDLYPDLQQIAADGTMPAHNKVRYEVLRRTGYFVTESSEHFSEYVPWFIKRDRPDLIEQFNIPLDEYPRRCESQIEKWQVLRSDLQAGKFELSTARSNEYAAGIIHSMETGEPRVIYGNVPNDGLISNLPQGASVEVPCLVDRNGVQPTAIGELPAHLAAMMQTNVNVQALTVEAIMTGNRDSVYHAAMLDPHTAAELDLDQIWHLVDDLIDAHGTEFLPDFTSVSAAVAAD